MAGLEVEGAAQVGAGLTGAIVAEIRGKRPHPRADKLTLVDVFDGQGHHPGGVRRAQRADPRRARALPAGGVGAAGATLPSGMVLGDKEVRGVRSPGIALRRGRASASPRTNGGHPPALSPEDGVAIGRRTSPPPPACPDVVLELNVTPNRPDCLGHVGVPARVAALFAAEGARLSLPAPDSRRPGGRGPGGGRRERRGARPRGLPALHTARVNPRRDRQKRAPCKIRLRLQRLGVRSLFQRRGRHQPGRCSCGGSRCTPSTSPACAAGGSSSAAPPPARSWPPWTAPAGRSPPDDLLIADAEARRGRRRGHGRAGQRGHRRHQGHPAGGRLLHPPAWVRRTAKVLKLQHRGVPPLRARGRSQPRPRRRLGRVRPHAGRALRRPGRPGAHRRVPPPHRGADRPPAPGAAPRSCWALTCPRTSRRGSSARRAWRSRRGPPAPSP